MIEDSPQDMEAAALHHRAEERLRRQSEDMRALSSGADSQSLVHELQLRLVELQIQNQDLRGTRAALEAA